MPDALGSPQENPQNTPDQRPESNDPRTQRLFDILNQEDAKEKLGVELETRVRAPGFEDPFNERENFQLTELQNLVPKEVYYHFMGLVESMSPTFVYSQPGLTRAGVGAGLVFELAADLREFVPKIFSSNRRNWEELYASNTNANYKLSVRKKPEIYLPYLENIKIILPEKFRNPDTKIKPKPDLELSFVDWGYLDQAKYISLPKNEADILPFLEHYYQVFRVDPQSLKMRFNINTIPGLAERIISEVSKLKSAGKFLEFCKYSSMLQQCINDFTKHQVLQEDWEKCLTEIKDSYPLLRPPFDLDNARKIIKIGRILKYLHITQTNSREKSSLQVLADTSTDEEPGSNLDYIDTEWSKLLEEKLNLERAQKYGEKLGFAEMKNQLPKEALNEVFSLYSSLAENPEGASEVLGKEQKNIGALLELGSELLEFCPERYQEIIPLAEKAEQEIVRYGQSLRENPMEFFIFYCQFQKIFGAKKTAEHFELTTEEKKAIYDGIYTNFNQDKEKFIYLYGKGLEALGKKEMSTGIPLKDEEKIWLQLYHKKIQLATPTLEDVPNAGLMSKIRPLDEPEISVTKERFKVYVSSTVKQLSEEKGDKATRILNFIKAANKVRILDIQ